MEEEDRVEVKLGVSKVPRTKQNGKASTISVLANFKCGLPDAIKRNKAEFALYAKSGKRERQSKSRVMVVEDAQNKVCYYGKRRSSEVDQTKMIGIFDPKTRTVNLVPVTCSFNMKPQRLRTKADSDEKYEDKSYTEKFEDLVGTFGSKFAVKNMNKQTRLRKTKTATVAAMDKMDTSVLMADDDDDDQKTNRK